MYPKKKKTNDFEVVMRNLSVNASNELRTKMLSSILVPYMQQLFREHQLTHSQIREKMMTIAQECVATRFVDSRFIAEISDVVSLEIQSRRNLKTSIIKDFISRLDTPTIKATESLGLEIADNLTEISEMEKEVSSWEGENIDGENGTSQFIEACYFDCCNALKKFLPDQYKLALNMSF